jgi:hypothetical protein
LIEVAALVVLAATAKSVIFPLFLRCDLVVAAVGADIASGMLSAARYAIA